MNLSAKPSKNRTGLTIEVYMSKIGQHVQQLQEDQPEPFEPDPEYDWQEIQKKDPGYTEFLKKLNEQPF